MADSAEAAGGYCAAAQENNPVLRRRPNGAPTITAMAQPFDICIRGTGIVGRTLALLLAREKRRVALVAPPAAGDHPTQAGHHDVRAYALNAASRNLLESLRCWPDAAHTTPVQRMHVLGDRGGSVEFDAAAQQVDALAWIVDVPALEARLAEAVRFQPQVEVVDAPVSAALTVVCEGRTSATRAEFGVDFDVTPYAQHAIAARLTCKHHHQQVARQWFSPDGILAFLPTGGLQGNSVAVVWSVSPEQAALLMELPPQEFAGRVHEAGGGALGALTLVSERAAWPLQLARADRWCGTLPPEGRNHRSWVLAGDAAHNVHPLAGQGLNLGLADVQALANVLHARDYWRSVNDLRLLRRYERERKAAVWTMGLATDGLQQLFTRQNGPLPMLRNAGMKGFDMSGPFKDFVARQAMGMQ